MKGEIEIFKQFKNEVRNHIKNNIDNYDLKVEHVKGANNKISSKIKFSIEAELCELSCEKISPEEPNNFKTVLTITYK